jgi:hypothetical protein
VDRSGIGDILVYFSIGALLRQPLVPKGIGDRRSGIVRACSFFVGYHLRKSPTPKTFRESAIDDTTLLLARRLLFSFFCRCRMDRSSTISLVKLIHGDERPPSADAGEIRRSAILVFSSDFRHF